MRNPETLILQLTELRSNTVRMQDEIEQEYEKFQVALSGVLRILSGDGSTILKAIQGSPEEVKGYLIQLASQLRQHTTESWESLKLELDNMIELAQGE
ncbi:MAG: hypothetical protein KAW94_00510 [Candidatus Thorarchaeota archaeon]|nr:hypothetical protein [Candidatus Thorarchaeota archaeon]MCK4739948.1 hypothetical protein [Candidatus Thorarchaeota archaeon]